jgi:hypothetical protein
MFKATSDESNGNRPLSAGEISRDASPSGGRDACHAGGMNAPARMGIPLRPDPDASRERAVASVARAVLASARGTFENDRAGAAARIVRTAWPDDRQALRIVTRAASAPAQTGVTGWAAEFAITRIEDALAPFGPLSVGAQLLRRGTVLSFVGIHAIQAPGISTASGAFTSFVAEGAAVPVRQMVTSSGVTFGPRKLGTIFVLTREMIESSNAERLVQLVMTESLSVALDAALFSNAAGTSTQPPGLLNGITPIAAATGGGIAALNKDISALVSAVSAVSALELVFVTDPGTATRIKMSVFDFPFDVLASNAVTAGTVICIGLNGLVSAGEPSPRIDASRDVEISLDTQPPTDIAGGGGTAVKSMFQTDEIAIRFVAEMAWALRTPAAIAFVASVTW